MAFTDIGQGGGRIYDINENQRMADYLAAQELEFDAADKADTKKKTILRYAIIGVCSVGFLVLLKLALGANESK